MTISIYCGALGNSDTVKDVASPKSEGHFSYKEPKKKKKEKKRKKKKRLLQDC